MKTITAKFNSKCGKCGNTISAGAQCRWEKGSAAQHVTCPVVGDVKFTLTGDDLRERLAALQDRLDTLRAVRADYILERAGEPAEAPCGCEGRGIVTTRVNVSDTLDYSDFVSYPHPCGTTLTTRMSRPWGGSWSLTLTRVRVTPIGFLPTLPVYEYQSPSYDAALETYNVALEAVPLAASHLYGEGAGRWVSYHPEGMAARNEACVARSTTYSDWRCEVIQAERAFENLYPELLGTASLVKWTLRDLEILRGDTASVLNRNKRFTGTVRFVGEQAAYGAARFTRYGAPDMRVQVALADGTTKGGAYETAELVSRTATAPTSKPATREFEAEAELNASRAIVAAVAS